MSQIFINFCIKPKKFTFFDVFIDFVYLVTLIYNQFENSTRFPTFHLSESDSLGRLIAIPVVLFYLIMIIEYSYIIISSCCLCLTKNCCTSGSSVKYCMRICCFVFTLFGYFIMKDYFNSQTEKMEKCIEEYVEDEEYG